MTPIYISWTALLIAILTGVAGTILMKKSQGLQYLKPTVGLIFFYTASFIALTFALKQIQLSIVYAVWSGVGTILMALIGIFHFHEKASPRKALYLLLIVIGVIGIHCSA